LIVTSPTPLITRVHSAEATVVSVNPSSISSSIGQSFTLNISITNVTDLNAWQLYLLFNPAILNCTGISIPPDNIFAQYVIDITITVFDNTAGYIHAFCALNGTMAVSGSGTLCQIGLKCKAPETTILSIAAKMQAPTGTYLQDPDYNLIPFDAVDGSIEVTGSNLQRSAFNATQDSTTYPVITYSNSSITSFNYNDTQKTIMFDTSGPANTTGIAFVTVPKQLLNGTFAVLVNDTAITIALSGNQTHNIISFTYTHSTQHNKILLTIPGDVNGDRVVDMLDISIVIDAFMTSPNDPWWNALADVNGDSTVDRSDILFEVDSFLCRWSP
jgi:hypothetical protein